MEIMKFIRVQWDRVVAVGAIVLGALFLLLGYIGVSGTEHVAAQLPYFISGGLGGIFLLAIACMAWLSADLRDEWRELRALRVLLDEDARVRDARPNASDVASTSVQDDGSADENTYSPSAIVPVALESELSSVASTEPPAAPRRKIDARAPRSLGSNGGKRARVAKT